MRTLAVLAALCLGIGAVLADAFNWAALNADQRSVLAPWAGEWDSFPEERRKALATLAAQHPSGSIAQQQLRADIARYAGMLETERARLMERYKAFKSLSPAEQQRYMREWLLYDRLPEEEKEVWRQKARSTK